jgi:His-Xaa-Ser system radical SAM maturase HxsC
MKCFQGIAHNIANPILCKIIAVAGNSTDKTNSFAFLTESLNGQRAQFGVISKAGFGPSNDADQLGFRLLDPDASLAIGDILLLEPSGLGTLLYQQGSSSNAVLLTESCNSRCLMCPQPPKRDQEDLVDLALRIISLMEPDTRALGITGGEPTLKWEGLIAVMCSCREHIPSASIQLLTNARMLKQYQKARELVDAAKDSLLACVPLYGDVDSLHDDMVGASGAFWESLEGIHNLERAGIPVELRTVITRLNYQRLPQWAEYLYRTFPFLAHVALMGLEPIGLARDNIHRLWVDPLDYAVQLERAVKILHRRNMSVSIYNHQLCTLPTSLWPFARRSISEWKTIYLPQCEGCRVKPECGGLFSSARGYNSRGIAAIQYEEV